MKIASPLRPATIHAGSVGRIVEARLARQSAVADDDRPRITLQTRTA